MVDAALDKLGLNYDFDLISDLPEIAKAGVTNPPALMINGEIKIEGKIPTVDEVVEVLKNI
ncbi:thioredoxin family protein [Caloranaerobacter sp. DY30410]|uniref:thioredoxin family protein n=1 Tax=Caloranaerobacter sp. DY30410 TaxID=3238305 RepID=UPI003D018C47